MSTKTHGKEIIRISVADYGEIRDSKKEKCKLQETYMQVRKQQLELDMEQQIGSK